MGNMKVVEVPITLDRKRKLRYDLNALEVIEELYGDIMTALEDLDKRKIKAFKTILYAGLIHEDESLTLDGIGKMVTFATMKSATNDIANALSGNIKASEKSDSEGEGEEKKQIES
jgi:hypothetical protein